MLLHDTGVSGRPDIASLIEQTAKQHEAEAVFIVVSSLHFDMTHALLTEYSRATIHIQFSVPTFAGVSVFAATAPPEIHDHSRHFVHATHAYTHIYTLPLHYLTSPRHEA